MADHTTFNLLSSTVFAGISVRLCLPRRCAFADSPASAKAILLLSYAHAGICKVGQEADADAITELVIRSKRRLLPSMDQAAKSTEFSLPSIGHD